MTRLVVTGHASLDYALRLSGPVAADRTTRMRRAGPWPRTGGCPFYIARAAVAAGCRASPVMWVGDDRAGAGVCAELDRLGIDREGVAQIAGARSPAAVMLYHPDGRCACLHDPGPAGREGLTGAQRQVLASASHLCVAVGPGALIAPILAHRPPTARLYWAVKDDPACFTPAACHALAAQADVIFCSAPERHLLPRTDAVIVETRGAGGVCLSSGGANTEFTTGRIDCDDTTGAGDTLAGGFIAAEMAGGDRLAAVRAGLGAAARLLRERETMQR